MLVNLKDSSFKHQAASTLGSENADIPPAHFSWDRECRQDGYTFVTDMHIKDAKRGDKAIGWLLESGALSDAHYISAYARKDHFHRIFTYMKSYLELDPDKYIFYPFGGSWVRQEDWGLHRKSKLLSIMGTQKQRAEGHQMRHKAIRLLGDRADVWGRGYKPIGSKTKALNDYHFTVVIENCRKDYYFSEKLIDAMSQGCVPIYWGCPSVGDYFNVDGIIPFRTLEELEDVITNITPSDYKKMLPALKDNLELCELYRCAEDWIWQAYPEFFGRDVWR